jgi:hypothetical protein
LGESASEFEAYDVEDPIPITRREEREQSGPQQVSILEDIVHVGKDYSLIAIKDNMDYSLQQELKIKKNTELGIVGARLATQVRAMSEVEKIIEAKWDRETGISSERYA